MNQEAPQSSGTRETRLLLAIIGLSVVMLLVLARLRFPAQGSAEAVEPAPTPLERLASQASYDELAATIADLDRRVRAGLLLIPIEPHGGFSAAARVTPNRAVLRLRPEEMPGRLQDGTTPQVLGRDPVTGIAVIDVALDPGNVVIPRTGIPRAGPRYVAVADATPAGIAFRPAYVGATTVVDDRIGGHTLFAMTTAPQTVPPGSALFTLAGTFIGIATASDGTVTLLPADALKALADNPPQSLGIDLGIDVQPLTPSLARVAGATGGVMVSSVADDSPAAGLIQPGDVLQTVDGAPTATAADFDAIERTRPADKTIDVALIRHGAASTVTIPPRTATPPKAAPADDDPGLTVRRSGGRTSVTAVRPGSAAALAGIHPGDIIAAVNGATALDVRRSFRELQAGTGALVTIERDGRQRIVALEKPRAPQ